MPQSRKLFYEFGPFRLEPAQHRLLGDGKSVPLTPKAFETLLLLVENAGQALDKNELLKRLWPDTFVEEATLAKNISTIRKALGEAEGGNRYIETLSKFGYRFIAEVRHVESEAAPPGSRSPRTMVAAAALAGVVLLASNLWLRERPSRSASSPPRKVMLAVLPFENLSGNPEEDYFSDGLTEEMIGQLARLNPERVAVIARTTATQFKGTKKSVSEIGQELGVDYVLEGSVRREGERVRISAQLVQVRDQTHLWAEDYDRDLRDILTIQRDVAHAVAREIELRLTPERQARLARVRQVDPEAFEFYLKGRYFWKKRTEEGIEKSRDYFAQAIAKEPNSAPAYAGLAETYAPTEPAKAEPLVKKALELDPALPEAHVSNGILLMHRFQWAEAEQALRRALELNPNSAQAHLWYSVFLQGVGRLDAAISEAEQALKLDPLSVVISHELGVAFYHARRYDQAIAQLRKTLELDSTYQWSRWRLAQTYAWKGMFVEAEATCLSAPCSLVLLSRLVPAYVKWGMTEKARMIQARAEKTPVVNPYDMAAMNAGLGEKDKAFARLNALAEIQYVDMLRVKVDPRLDLLRSDPRFGQLLGKLGLAAEKK